MSSLELNIINIITNDFSNSIAIYLFGSFASNQNNKNSDVDIAILLNHVDAKEAGKLSFGELHKKLISGLNKDVDLINLRISSTVLQKEIIAKGRCIFCTNIDEKDKFEMLTLSFYQILNKGRAHIIQDFANNFKKYNAN